jgi:hypothetical protein
MFHTCVERFDVMGVRGNILGWEGSEQGLSEFARSPCRIRSRSPRRGVLRSAPPPPPLAGRRCIDAAAMVSSTPSFPSSSSALTTHFQVPPPRISDFIGADRIWLSGRRDRAAARRGDRDHPPRSRWPGSVGLGFCCPTSNLVAVVLVQPVREIAVRVSCFGLLDSDAWCSDFSDSRGLR